MDAIAMAKGLKTTPWDSAAYLKDGQDTADYLDAVIAEGDAALLAHALQIVARAVAR